MKRKRNYKEEYKKRTKESKLKNWYRNEDIKKGREFNLTLEQVKVLIEQPCFYCGIEPANGIDRKNSDIGHINGNIIPSCYHCNMILGDIPYNGKLLLREGLRQLREKGFYDIWEPPPFRID